jgi:hypothetical protein
MNSGPSAKGLQRHGGSCDLYTTESTSTNKPADSQLIGLFSRERCVECLALLMKLRGPSCREFHLAALTWSLAKVHAGTEKKSLASGDFIPAVLLAAFRRHD